MAAQKTELIEIKPIEMVRVPVRIVGDTPLIVHAWSEKAKRMMLEAQKRQEERAEEPCRRLHSVAVLAGQQAGIYRRSI